jgi:hypothetical protein
MKYKSLLTGAALFLSVVAVGSAKSWDVVIDSTARAGAMELPAGDYHVRLNGEQAVFTSMESGRKYSVDVTVEKVAKKFDETALESTNQGNLEVIENIRLGGTSTKIDFVEPVHATH